jgi:hypothetical protein
MSLEKYMRLNKLKNYNTFTDFFILHNGSMILLSMFGTEQIIKSLLANIDLKIVKRLELENVDMNINLDNPSNLKSMKKRVVNDVYDDMHHYMLYSSKINHVEGAINSYVISKKENHNQAVWNKVKDMSATPMLEDWQDIIINFLQIEEKIVKCDVYGKLGIYCSYIELNSLTFLNDFVSSSIKIGNLKV